MKALAVVMIAAFALWFTMLCTPGADAYVIDDSGNRVVITDEPVAVASGYTAQALPDGGVERWRGLVAAIFPAENVDRVLRVMTCESHGDPNATGGVGERGLMQIHPIHSDSTYDPEGNLRAAYRISAGGTTFAAWAGGRGDRWAEGGGC